MASKVDCPPMCRQEGIFFNLHHCPGSGSALGGLEIARFFPEYRPGQFHGIPFVGQNALLAASQRAGDFGQVVAAQAAFENLAMTITQAGHDAGPQVGGLGVVGGRVAEFVAQLDFPQPLEHGVLLAAAELEAAPVAGAEGVPRKKRAALDGEIAGRLQQGQRRFLDKVVEFHLGMPAVNFFGRTLRQAQVGTDQRLVVQEYLSAKDV